MRGTIVTKLTQNILVCTDFSDAADLAISAGVLLATQNEAKVTLAHVVDGHALDVRPTHYGESVTSSVVAESETEAKIHGALKGLRESRFGDVPDVKTVVIVDEDIAHGIVTFAGKEDVDMIVLSTHGRSGLAHALIGSVAEKVVRTASCPVLTLRSKSED